MYSPPLLVSGIVLGVGGTVAVPMGVMVMFVSAISRSDDGVLPGGVLIAAGSASILASVPMIIVGAHQVSVEGGPRGSAGLSVKLTF